jgi:maleamate amidohydrolase
MELSSKTARELYQELQRDKSRPVFGFGRKVAIINVDVQHAYTRPDEFPTAYETDPLQCQYIDQLSKLARRKGLPVAWTYVAYSPSGTECLAWGQRSNTPNSLQNVKFGSRRSEIDERILVDPEIDILINKKMASAFHETFLPSTLRFLGVDTIVVTGGSTSGCVRATVVDGISEGFRVIVPEECVSDRHESPHFANLYDMKMKYADVLPVSAVLAHLEAQADAVQPAAKLESVV